MRRSANHQSRAQPSRAPHPPKMMDDRGRREDATSPAPKPGRSHLGGVSQWPVTAASVVLLTSALGRRKEEALEEGR
jgi:hypothetical protein